MRRPSATVSAAVLPTSVGAGASPLIRGVLALLLATVLLVLPPGADTSAHAATDDLVLAVEEADLGPLPQPREAEGNSARELAGYENQDLMFTWGASILLLGLVVTLMVVGGALWFLLVIRPQKQNAAG